MHAVQVYFEHIFILGHDLSFGKYGGLRSGKLEQGVGVKWKKWARGRWMGPQAIRPDSTLAEIEPKVEMSFFNYFFEGILKDTLTAKNSDVSSRKNPS